MPLGLDTIEIKNDQLNAGNPCMPMIFYVDIEYGGQWYASEDVSDIGACRSIFLLFVSPVPEPAPF